MKKAKKILTLVACAVLLVCISVGATLAYLQAQTEIVTNTFTVGDIAISLDEATVEKEEGTDNYVQKYDEEGNALRTDATDSEVEQTYKLHPGIEVLKDPTIHLDPTSENCYIVAEIVVSVKDNADTDPNTIDDLRTQLKYEHGTITGLLNINGIVNGGALGIPGALGTENVASNTIYFENAESIMTQTVDVDNGKNIFYIYYKTESVLGDANRRVEYELFEGITIPDTWDGTALANLQGLNIEVKGYAVQADGFKGVVDAFKAAFPDQYAVAELPVEE